jgi:hypothetical protein
MPQTVRWASLVTSLSLDTRQNPSSLSRIGGIARRRKGASFYANDCVTV